MKHFFKQIHHAMTINRTLVRYGLDEFLAPTPFAKFRRISKLFSFTASHVKDKPRGERLSLALTELGPVYIKLGQMLSTRPDLIPFDIAQELEKLQDQVKPFSNDDAKAIIEQQLDAEIESVFSSFDSKPMASASIAQVHSAILQDGSEVVVKVLRPGIRKKIQKDLDMMHSIASWTEQYSSEARRFRIKEVIDDYDATIKDEIDLRIEAAHCSKLGSNFENSELLYVPKVHWDYCRNKVMVMEKIHGIPIGDVQAIKDAGVDMEVLANRGVEIFFTQVFRDSFFHADMHPGNVFVNVTNPQAPQYIAIDCGIMGTLVESDKRYLADNFLAFFNQDYRRIAELHVKSGWVDRNVSIDDFESAIREACEPIHGKTIAEISFGHFLLQLFQTARRFNMKVQPQLVLLQKTLLYIEGLGRQLYPDLDLLETAQPFLKQWVKDQYSPQALFKQLQQEAPILLDELPKVPRKILDGIDNVNHIASSFDEVKAQMVELEQHKLKQQYAQKHAVIGSAFGIIAALLFVAFPQNWWPSVILGAGSVYFLIKSLWPSK